VSASDFDRSIDFVIDRPRLLPDLSPFPFSLRSAVVVLESTMANVAAVWTMGPIWWDDMP
jgi:hypothetical protein